MSTKQYFLCSNTVVNVGAAVLESFSTPKPMIGWLHISVVFDNATKEVKTYHNGSLAAYDIAPSKMCNAPSRICNKLTLVVLGFCV